MHIPETIEAATEQLKGLGALLQASEWERAAIVYAFTHLNEKAGRPAIVKNHNTLSTVEFGALGIIGLKDPATVRRYHLAWQDAIDQNVAAVTTPGIDYILPTVDWPPEGRSARAAGASPKRAAEAISDDKDYTRELVEQIPLEDLFFLINTAQAKVDANSTPRPVDEDGPLDVMVASVDMTDALHRLSKAEPAWSRAVREGQIDSLVAEKHWGELSLVEELMKIAIDSDSFERSVPR